MTITEENRSTVVYEDVDSVSIVVDDDTEYDDAWEAMLDEDGGDWCSFDGGSGRVVVTIVEVDIAY